MVWQIIKQEQRPDGLYVAAKFWATAADRAAGKPARLVNDFRFPSLQTRHQRIRTGPRGGLLHSSGAEVDPAEVREFLEAEGIHWARDASGQPVRDRRGRWRPDKSGQSRARSGVSLAPFLLDRPQPQEFDPQWLRETFSIGIEHDIAVAVDSYERRAAERGWSGDRRGTTTTLQVSAPGRDGYSLYAFGTPYLFTNSSYQIYAGGSTDSSGYAYHAFFYFAGLEAVSGTVSSAYLQLWGYSSDDGTPNTQIAAEDVTYTSPPADDTDHQSRVRTSASVTWNSPTLSWLAFVDSPNIATVVQEVVDLGEASSILILQDGQTTADGVCFPTAYDSNTARAAKLTIDHGAAGGSGPGGQPSLLRSPNDSRRPIYRR